MLQANEVANLVIAVILGPLLYGGLRGLPHPSRRAFAASYSAMLVAYICTVAEGFFLSAFFDLLEHVAYAAAGALLLLGVWYLRDALGRLEEAG